MRVIAMMKSYHWACSGTSMVTNASFMASLQEISTTSEAFERIGWAREGATSGSCKHIKALAKRAVMVMARR
jgi:hypothetical protein